jgi:hypothetical protein
MQISVQDGSDTPVVIIDGPDRAQGKTMGPSTWSGDDDAAIQARAPVRLANQKPIYRGGRLYSSRISGVRLCATVAVAQTWLLTHLSTCPRGDKIIFKEGETTVATLNNAVIKRIAHRFQGVTIHLEYHIEGGSLTTS